MSTLTSWCHREALHVCVCSTHQNNIHWHRWRSHLFCEEVRWQMRSLSRPTGPFTYLFYFFLTCSATKRQVGRLWKLLQDNLTCHHCASVWLKPASLVKHFFFFALSISLAPPTPLTPAFCGLTDELQPQNQPLVQPEEAGTVFCAFVCVFFQNQSSCRQAALDLPQCKHRQAAYQAANHIASTLIGAELWSQSETLWQDVFELRGSWLVLGPKASLW